jgi:membrane-bound serine protease (ClpP class)
VRSLQAFLALVIAFLAAAALAGSGQAQAAPRVLAVEVANDVNPVSADFAIDQIERANEDGYSAVVILLDTPGGLAESMRKIVEAELASSIPVLVYVSPDGARAASAGVWIGQAADILAMAPQTNIGSSTPVSVEGGDIPRDLRRKVVNDAAASLRALAEEHGRNGDWAEAAVRQASNLTATQALEQNVIDLIAPDLPTLLDDVDGTTTVPKGFVLDTAGADVTTAEMSIWQRILDTIIDPNIIVLLMSLGVLAITVELFNPGLIFPAAFGAIALIVGLFGLQVLPFSWAGILLMIVAFGFFVAEAFVVSHGALALAGAIAFVFGALLLFDPAGEAYQVSLPVAIAIGVALALFAGLAVAKALAARRRPATTGSEELVGASGVVRRTLEPDGLVFVHGELWRARAIGEEPIPEGTQVRVERLADGLVLEVVPGEASEPLPEDAPGKVPA